MKRILGIIAAGVLAVASFHAAQAADEAAAGASMKAQIAAPAEADVAVKPATQQFTLKDGTTLTVDDQSMAWTADASGKNAAATDGDKETADGKKLTVKEGKITAGLETPATEAPAAGEVKKEEAPAKP